MALRSGYVVLAVPALATLVIAGCGGNGTVSSGPDGIANQVVPSFKIQEYVGDGHNGTKPMPPFFPLPGTAGEGGEVQTQGYATALHFGAAPLLSNVFPKSVDWYYLPPTSLSLARIVVTQQPVVNRDPDLFVLEGEGCNFGDGAHCESYSTRTPNGGQLDEVRGGYAPDWCSVNTPGGGTGGYPTAWVAAYGSTTGAAGARYFTLEADVAGEMDIGTKRAGSLSQGDSHWFHYYYTGPSPDNRILRLAAVSGDPDVYVYDTSSGSYVGGHSSAGGGDASFFTPAGPLRFWFRVYAYTTCKYVIKLL